MTVEVVAERLDHHPLAGGDGSQLEQFGFEQRAGIGVGEQPGLRQDEVAHRREVVDRRCVAVLVEPFPRDGVALLGTFAEGEQGLVASGRGSATGDCKDVVGCQVRRRQPSGRLRERAVAALVAAQHRQGDEDLGRICHPAPERSAARLSSAEQELIGWQREHLGGIHGRTLLASCWPATMEVLA